MRLSFTIWVIQVSEGKNSFMDQIVKRVPSQPSNSPGRRKSGITISGRSISIVILVVFLIGLAWFGKMYMTKHETFAGQVQKDRYQAVFLTNGQVYFGKIDSMNRQGYVLKDIYYLQVQGDNAALQQTKDKSADDQNLSLAKLGSELHGPEDSMYIENKQVLFWENLKDNSKVVDAIKDNKKK